MSIDAVLAELRTEYAPELAAELDRLFAQLAEGTTEARRTAHRIGGTAGSYGFDEISTLARAIETALETGAPVDEAAVSALRRHRASL